MGTGLVIIDAGHGGDAAVGRSSPYGARGPGGTLEKDVTLELARRVAWNLGGEARLTRTADINLSLRDRCALARRLGARAFVSLHANDGPGRGAEVYVHSRASSASAALAGAVQRRVAREGDGCALGTGELAVLEPGAHDPSTAACLLEVDYLSDRHGERRLRDPATLDRLGRAIAAGVSDYLAAAAGGARAAPGARGLEIVDGLSPLDTSSPDYQLAQQIRTFLAAPALTDLERAAALLEASYAPQAAFTLKNAKRPAEDVTGIGPVETFKDDAGAVRVVKFPAKADVDDDGSGPDHADPSHQDELPLKDDRAVAANADDVPYIVLSQSLLSVIGGGDVGRGAARVGYGSFALVVFNGRVLPALFGDAGPFGSAGEVSFNLADALGVLSRRNPPASTEGDDSGRTAVTYRVFVGSVHARVPAADMTAAAVRRRLAEFLTSALKEREAALMRRCWLDLQRRGVPPP